MNRIATSFALAALILSLAACPKKDEQAAKPTPADAAADKAPEPPPADAAPEKAAVVDVTDAAFATPESILYLADQDVYLVSNINGDPFATDDNGSIAKVGPDGKVLEPRWIDGAKDDVKLDAPKGMAVRDGKLYVADITRVRIFDLATGAAKGEVVIKGATFLNDVAAADGKVYVSDSGLAPGFKPSGSDAVYELAADDKAAKKLIAGADLKQPNGVAVVDGNVWVVSFGGKELYRVADGKKADVTELPTGGLDGLAALGDGRVAVSSWEGKAVYVGKPGAAFTALAENVESPADLTVDAKRKRVLVPLFMGNALKFVPFE